MMQWLIDLIAEKVIAQIGIPPVYIHRGDPTAWDYLVGAFIRDLQWHPLDLSHIVPTGASAVNLRCFSFTSIVNPIIMFARHTITHGYNLHHHQTPIAQLGSNSTFTIGIDPDRLIQYAIADTGIIALDLIVCGWWL